MTAKATTKTRKPATKAEAKPAAKPTACRCGCGQPTITAEARYLPGHDARHAGSLAKAWIATDDAEARTQIREAIKRELSPALQAKANRMIERAERITAERAARAEAKAAKLAA